LNYVHQQYTQADTAKAIEALETSTPCGPEVAALLREFEARETLEAQLTHDADQLEIILTLKEQHDLGHPRAREWIEQIQTRLRTEAGRKLAGEILATASDEWWVWWPRETGTRGQGDRGNWETGSGTSPRTCSGGDQVPPTGNWA